MRRPTLGWIVPIGFLVGLGIALAGCGIKTVSFPADAFLTQYTAIRLQVQDDTYPARAKCAKGVTERTKPLCDDLTKRMDAWADRDKAVLQAILTGGTVDRDTLDAAVGYVAPILKLASGILLAP